MLTLLKPCAAPILGLALAALGLGGPAWADPVLMKPAIPARAMAKLSHVASLVKTGSDIRIVAFGSSSTEGSGASSPSAAYPAQLQDDLQRRLDNAGAKHSTVTVLNRGKGGDDAEAMARRLDRDVLTARPDLVIWQTGSNDPMTGVTVERFTELTRQGITAMRAAGSDVILMDQQWCRRLSTTNGAERYGEALHALALELDVPVIRRNALMRTWAASGLLSLNQMIGPDGLHMTDAGYDRLAEAATAQILVNAGLIPADPLRNN
ncbi:SGNH/GDSL hydrolase family protein [Methylobacterium sp. W2]|uniref:SGNH/GDSL hydrolase family protein n=1 Tax=Methylobacterium sp. W2 TaxID=2598107 RepID=UPI001D0C0EAE|nr:SGNH/GDSL hydrolase family protein [Methylobacterium sp. W2]MCC0806551.1 SGNH/GDSL hydrolase family protein [Methylobacterium sp. W2]